MTRLLLLAVGAAAHRQYLGLVPNGEVFDKAGWPALGHVAPSPNMYPKSAHGFPRNPFGVDFAKSNFKWTVQLCKTDSDGDGVPNGVELGDPQCTWYPGLPQTALKQPTGHPGLPGVTVGGMRAYWEHAAEKLSNNSVSYVMNHGRLAPPLFILHYVFTPVMLLVCVLLRFRKVPGAHYPSKLAIFVITYVVGHIGVFVGNHRCYSHSACKPTTAGHWILAILSVYALQGPAAQWALYHRTHHRFCEQPPLDLHSPMEGFMWAQGTFFWYPSEHIAIVKNLPWVVPDIVYDENIPEINRHAGTHIKCWLWFLIIFACTAVLVAGYQRRRVLAEFVRKTRDDYLSLACTLGECVVFALCSVIYYFFLPSCLSMQITSLVNSAVHIWGDMPYEDGMSLPCTTYNNAFLFWPMLGENWHNNHHGNPRSHSTWVEWYQIDFQGLVIRLFELTGLATDVHTVTPLVFRPGYEKLPFYSVAFSQVQMAMVTVIAVVATRWLLNDERRESQRITKPLLDGDSGK